MRMPQIYVQLQNIIDDLKSNELVELIELSDFKPLSDEQVNSLLLELNNSDYSPYMALVKDYLNFPVSMRIAWEYRMRGTYNMGGRIYLHNTAIALLDEKLKPFKPGIENLRQNAFGFKYFDKDLKDGESFGATIELDKTLKRLKVGVFMDESYYQTDLSLERYIYYLRLTKGFLYWQFLFCKDVPEILKKDFRENYYRRMISDLPLLFKDHDYSELKKLVEEF
jgi:hypothetical protein